MLLDKSIIAVFSVVCSTKYLESNVKQFLMLYYFVPGMAKFCNWKNEASATVMPDILENIEQ